ncbi:MAG: YceI family protein [Dokdonella sp.]
MNATRLSIPYCAVVAIVLSLSAPTARAASQTYQLDPDHTRVTFGWTHLDFSHQNGRFNGVTGTLTFDPANPAAGKVTVTIPIAEMDTGVVALDKHLQSPEFFDAAQFPTAQFTSTAVKATNSKHLQVIGNLTIHGVTKPVTLAVTINKTGTYPAMMGGLTVAGFDATTTIKRSDFGIAAYVPMVSDEITIGISSEAAVEKK